MIDWLVETFLTPVYQFKGERRESRRPTLRFLLIALEFSYTLALLDQTNLTL
jgi:hypothetical protein